MPNSLKYGIRGGRVYTAIIEFYRIFGEWGFWSARLIKFAEHVLLNSPYILLAIYMEIEAYEQPLQGYYGLHI